MSRRARRRIIACVDGTWYDADGLEGHPHGNNSNVFRIRAAIARDAVKIADETTVEQIVEYFPGIGTNKKPLEKWNSGITGTGCEQHIADVYKYCCRQSPESKDEFWFYGFSRGAYVVTAVAGLLAEIGALEYNANADSEFNENYKQAWNLYKSIKRGNFEPNKGKIWAIQQKSRQDIQIKFLGLLDTVKAINSDHDSTAHLLTFHKSISHVRHALALNERRQHFRPEMYGPVTDDGALRGRSLIQAWFVGAHADIGGGSQDDGLSLYPLQWLLIESQHQGLVLQHNFQPGSIKDPLALVFPSSKLQSPNNQVTIPTSPWEYHYANGITVQMHDLRFSHNHGNMQALLDQLSDKRRRYWWKRKSTDALSDPTDPKIQHVVRLNPGRPYIAYQEPRRPFRDGKLQGYVEGKHGPFGTIIHPSVYFVMDIYSRHKIEHEMQCFEKDINHFRNEQHPNKKDPWLTMEMEAVPSAGVKACRILVCGRAGVGKPTLINKVFGVPMTIESHMKHGEHNIDRAFESEHHPGIIIHDSRGFQAGNPRELKQCEDFVKRRSGNSNPKESLHAIWICIQTDTDRVVETSEAKMFKTLTKCARHLPVIIVGTKKDRFLNQMESMARKDLRERSGSDSADLDTLSREKAEKDLQARHTELKAQLAEECDLDHDSIQFLHVSRGTSDQNNIPTGSLLMIGATDDDASIRCLVNNTLELITNDEARLKCIAAQVVDTDPKVKQAIDESIRLLRHGIYTSSVGAVAVLTSAVSTPTISRILCDNILKCFGFPKIDPASVNNVMNKIIGWNLYGFLAQQITQSVTLSAGLLMLCFVTIGAASPLVAALSLLEIPTAGRMIIKCACDLILILDRAFKHGGKFVTSQDIEIACREYVATTLQGGWSKRKQVHAQVRGLIPLVSKKFWNVVRISIVRAGMEEIIQTNRWGPSAAMSRTDSARDVVLNLSLESLGDENELQQLIVHHEA